MHETLKLLEQRCFSTPGHLRHLSTAPLELVQGILQTASSTFVTGIGASEGPARLLVSCLSSSAEKPAQFIPLSGLVAGDHAAWTAGGQAAVLVIFSQALSPNARMALEAGRDFSATILVCSSDVVIDASIRSASGMNLHVVTHPPEGETGFLLRVTGPAIASAIALGLAALVTTENTAVEVREQWLACADAMEMRIHTPHPDVDLVKQPPIFLVYGQGGIERNHLLRWTLLEILQQCDPPVWDMLNFAHGAFQNIFETSRTIIVPRSLQDSFLEELIRRLHDMLRQTRHTLLDIPSELPRPWSMLEHLATVQAFVLEHLRRNPRDLCAWPGRGCDGALYLLDRMS
jgi:hypothetical protein